MSHTGYVTLHRDLLSEAFEAVSQGFLEKEEKKVLHFLEESMPELVPYFHLVYRKGRSSILKRLVTSLLREDVMGLFTKSYDLQVIDTIYAINLPAINDHWKKIISHLPAYGLQSSHYYKVYPLHNEGCLIIPVSCQYAFRRQEVEGSVLHVTTEGARELTHAAEMLELLRQTSDQDGSSISYNWLTLAEELCNGTANLTLSYAYGEQKKLKLQAAADMEKGCTTLEWVVAEKAKDKHFDASLFFESLSVEGHNLHPGAKTKMGMNPQDVFRYSPEFDEEFNLCLVAVRSDYMGWSSLEKGEAANASLFLAFPHLEGSIKEELAKKGLSLDEFVAIPVHPWQMEHCLQDIYGAEMEKGVILPLTSVTIPCRATSSFRTVVPVSANESVKTAIKVAVNSQMTSTVRSISPHTTKNAAEFSRLVKLVMEQEKELAKTFVPLYETAGFHFQVQEEEQSDGNSLKMRNLSVIFRDNVETLIQKDELAIVGSSLYAESLFKGKKILQELIEAYAASIKEGSLILAATQFFIDYAKVALTGYLTFMVKYGIGLEGHMQNSVPVFKHGRPVRMFFRDWGGARIYRDRLEKQGLQVNFLPGSITLTNDIEEMYNKVFYTVYQNHLGEMIQLISKCYGVNEGMLWTEIRELSKQICNQCQDSSQRELNVKRDLEEILKPEVQHKALTLMRLLPDEKGYCYAVVPNPLKENQG